MRNVISSRLIDNDHWEILAMGEKIKPIHLTNDVYLTPLQWKGFNDYSKLMREADLLLSLMLSPHPSYPPLEFSASGNLVVTNSYSVKTPEKLEEYSKNIMVADPTTASVTSILEKALLRINLGGESFDPNGTNKLLPKNWDEAFTKILPQLQLKIDKLHSQKHVPKNNSLEVINHFSNYGEYKKYKLFLRKNCYTELNKIKFSILTTVYDTNFSYLTELASSILLQKFSNNFEWIILDNGSKNIETINCLNEIAIDSSVNLIRVEENIGIIEGLRKCLETANGQYIIPIDSDDIIEPDSFEIINKFIIQNDYPDILYTDEDKLSEAKCLDPISKPDWDPVLFLHSCYIAHLTIFKRKLALKLGVYTDKNSEGCHDWDTFIRFHNYRIEPKHIPEVLYSWRMHQGSTSSNIRSKNYITNSHQRTLIKSKNFLEVKEVELIKR